MENRQDKLDNHVVEYNNLVCRLNCIESGAMGPIEFQDKKILEKELEDLLGSIKSQSNGIIREPDIGVVPMFRRKIKRVK